MRNTPVACPMVCTIALVTVRHAMMPHGLLHSNSHGLWYVRVSNIFTFEFSTAHGQKTAAQHRSHSTWSFPLFEQQLQHTHTSVYQPDAWYTGVSC